MSQSGVVFVDLDGTLILDNSFQLLILISIRKGGTRLLLQVLWSLARRVFDPRYRRLEMKRQVISAVAQSSELETIRGELVKVALASRSDAVIAQVEDYRRRGFSLVLATAAPQLYAADMAKAFGLNDSLATATEQPGADWPELAGVEKRAACEAWLSARAESAEVIAGIGDSLDDVPMFNLCSELTVQARPRILASIREATVADASVVEVDTESAQPDGGIWLWCRDGPRGPLSSVERSAVMRSHRGLVLQYVYPGRWTCLRIGSPHMKRRDCPYAPPLGLRLLMGLI